MGPPQRPAERPMMHQAQPVTQKEEKEANFDAINDVALSSGIDITKEEDLLRYRSRQGASFDTQGTSFSLGERGTFGQSSEKSQKDELYEKHIAAARRLAEQQAEHLNSPFFFGNVVRQKIANISKRDHNLTVIMDGVWDLQEKYKEREHVGTSMTHARDGSSIVTHNLKAPSKVDKGAPLEPMIALLALAGQERMRNLLEDAYGLARGRQITADGVVPPEWSSIATNPAVKSETTTTKAESVTDGPWDRPPTPPDSTKDTEPTIAFPASRHPITTALTMLSRQDRVAEEARLKRRAERKSRRAAATAETVAASLTNGPATEGSGLPIADGQKMTKKEREKLARADLTEEAATRNANTTAAMQIGGRSYSWMSGGSKKKPPPKPLGGGSSGGLDSAKSSAGTSSAGAGKAGRVDGAAGEDTKFGVWREDGVGGRGVQMRDWVAALEVDGHEKKTLEAARAKLGREVTGS